MSRYGQSSTRGLSQKLRARWTRLCYALKLESLACGLADDSISAYSIPVEKTPVYDSKNHSDISDSPVSVGTPLQHAQEKIDHSLPKVQSALVVPRKGEYEIQKDFPMPHVDDNEVMIRTAAVGLNPIDWKSVDYNFCLPEFPWVTGREMSGVVTRVGSAVTSWKEGDKVWTSTYYKDRRAGCFQQYVVVPEHTVCKIPCGLSFEEAACLGVAALTACMTLWRWLQVPMPSISSSTSIACTTQPEEWLLIWGGSTITGQFATQVASKAGFKVITVASQATKDISLRMGASHVVVRDGKSDMKLVEEIRSVSGSQIRRVIDLVGPKTAALALQTVSATEPVHFAPLAMASKDQITPANVTEHTVEMKQFVLNPDCMKYSQTLNRLIEAGDLTVPELNVIEGGLHDIIRGLHSVKSGNMGGKKLVVTLSE